MINRSSYYFTAFFSFLLFLVFVILIKETPSTIQAFDKTIGNGIRLARSSWLNPVVSTFTHLGDPWMIGLITAVTALRLAFLKEFRLVCYLVCNVALGAGALNFLLKNLIARPRPVVSHLVAASGYSFPSGHTMGSLLLFASIAIIIGTHFPSTLKRNTIIIGLALLIVLICLSRIFVGVHFPSDILGGLAIGGCWLCLSTVYFIPPHKQE